MSALARQILMNPSEHDDAVQEVFIEIWKHASRFDPSIASARTFVSVIARRRLIDRGRSEQTRQRGMVRLDGLCAMASDQEGNGRAGGAEAGAPVALATRESLETAAATVRREVEALRPAEQEALRMAFGLGWSHQRISEYTSQPLGTVKTTIRRALMRLRESIGQRPGTFATGGDS
ncbi:MAG: sigma-70 family RNA polymerase sigma factor [Phycisphaerales bacterium]|nr:sigma-70 family RNA polymerase sigma factor [Phycisphaerales bacterium]